MSITVNHITRRYGEQLALDDVSFEIKRGEIVGFIGPNGAGKSTTMKIITGLLAADSGDTLINGLDVATNPLEIRRIMGYLPENNPLYPEMYVREYLKYVARLYGMKKITSIINDIVDKTGLNKEVRKKIGELSKGYRQRVGLAQALIHNPEILILDEPTSGLDPNQIIDIRNLISNLGKEKTVLLSTHIMQEVEAICDRVIIIDKGKIVADEKSSSIREQSDEIEQTVIVEFDKEVTPGQLMKINGVKEVKKTGQNIWLIQASTEDDIRSKIFEHAVQNDLQVLSMQRKERKLEDVFRDLTNQSPT